MIRRSQRHRKLEIELNQQSNCGYYTTTPDANQIGIGKKRLKANDLIEE